MSYTIHADLLAEQKKTAYEPSLYLEILDHAFPHSLFRWWFVGYDNEPTCGVSIPGTVILRARHNTGVGVEIQRITDPDTQSQWQSWTLQQAGAGYPALFRAGSYLVLVWQDLSTKAVKWQRSSDNGVSWSAASTIWTPGYFLSHHQVGASETTGSNGGLFYANGNTVYVRAYDSLNNLFESEQSHNFGFAVSGLGAATFGDFWSVAVALSGYHIYADVSLIIGSWYDGDTPTWYDYLDVKGANYSIAWPSLGMTTSGRMWLSFYLYGNQAGGALWATSNVLASSGDGVHFSLHRRLEATELDRITQLEWSGGVVYSATYFQMWRSTPVTTVTVSESEIISYEASDARIELRLDNRATNYDGLLTSAGGYLGARLRFSRGLRVNGVARRATLPDYFLIQVSDESGPLRLIGESVALLLRETRPELVYYRSGLLTEVVTSLAALAGVSVTFGVIGSADSVSVSVSVGVGQSVADALNRLLDQYKLSIRPTSGSTLEVRELSLYEDTLNYSLLDHPIFQDEVSLRQIPSRTRAVVVGLNVGGDYQNEALQAELGRAISQIITRKHITTVAEAEEVALNSIKQSFHSVTAQKLRLLPAFQVQAHDVVEYPAFEAYQFIAAWTERYKLDDAAWLQELTLGVHDRTSSAVLSGGTSLGDGPRRATVESFDAITWRAMVRIEGSASTVEMAVGQWLPAALLTAGASVAVLLFDESNPNDGLVLGPYGAASPNADGIFVNEADYEDSDVLTKLKNVDGAGSGLDADLLDGQHLSYGLARANHTGTQAPSTLNPQGAGSGLDADLLDGSHLSAIQALDFGKVSALWESDGGAVAWQTDASGAAIIQNNQPLKGKSSNFPNLGTTTLAEKIGNVYLGTGKDIYPSHDGGPLFDRFVNWNGIVPLEHFSQGADDASWVGWASYTNYSTPNVLTYSRSILTVSLNVVDDAFRYRAAATGAHIALRMRVGITWAFGAGVMIDDGTGNADGNGANNFYRCYLYSSGLGAVVNAMVQRRIGGGAVTTDTSTFAMTQSAIEGVYIKTQGTRWTNWQAIGGVIGPTGDAAFATTTGYTWTPARVGMFFRQVSINNSQLAKVDWYDEATV